MFCFVDLDDKTKNHNRSQTFIIQISVIFSFLSSPVLTLSNASQPSDYKWQDESKNTANLCRGGGGGTLALNLEMSLLILFLLPQSRMTLSVLCREDPCSVRNVNMAGWSDEVVQDLVSFT